MSIEPPVGADALQFEHAEFEAPVILACAACKAAIGDGYFELNGITVCPACRDRLVTARDSGSGLARFLRAVVFALGAGAAGAFVWWAIREVTHLEIGLIAIGVGLVVAAAIRRATHGREGMVYQVIAVLVTYLAIVSADAPYVLKTVRTAISEDLVRARQAQAAELATATTPLPGIPDIDEAMARLPWAVWRQIGWYVLVSPFLQGFQNILGWLIIFFGLQQAWVGARGEPFAMTGPFHLPERRTPA